jgi:hypothetical protein
MVKAVPLMETVLNDIWDSTNHNISVAITDSTTGLVVSEETALTNTVHPIIEATHTTSGTPAIGIGAEISVIQETTANNNETIGSVGFVVDDETAATEDASFSVELMAAGAAKAEKFAVESTGEVTLVNGEVIDNTTDGTVEVTADVFRWSGFVESPYAELTGAAVYSITSASKATYFVVNYTDTAAASVVLDTDLTEDGRIIVIKDGELNANTNNITIGTEGAGTIDEAATYAMDADGEAVTLISDGTNWFIMSSYGE